MLSNRFDFVLLSVGVYINAGSRQDTLETSGAANLLRKMLLKGTQNASKT